MAQPLRQLKLDLRSPADHYDMIAHSQQRDFIAWTPQQGNKQWHSLNLEVARDKLSAWTNEPDIYITPNEFQGWRLIKLGHGLNALYADIDVHGEENPDLARLASVALSRCETAGIPTPNFVVYTGRGIHLYWLIDRVPFSALPRWQACQQQLVKHLRADPRAADSTRVLRVIGSVNSKSKSVVTAEMLNPKRYDFDWLADQVLPLARAEIRDIRAARARRGDALPRPKATGSIYDRWHLVYRDLQTICNHHWFGGVKEGHRDAMLHLMATSLSWFTQSDALQTEIFQTAREWMPTLSAREVASYTKSVVTRAKDDAEAGADPTHWQWGKGRYRYKRTTLVERLGDLITPELIPQLRAIVPDEIIRERKTARERARKHATGEVKATREEYLAQVAERRSEAVRLKAEGLSVRAIASTMGISPSMVSRYLNDPKNAAGVPSPCP